MSSRAALRSWSWMGLLDAVSSRSTAAVATCSTSARAPLSSSAVRPAAPGPSGSGGGNGGGSSSSSPSSSRGATEKSPDVRVLKIETTEAPGNRASAASHRVFDQVLPSDIIALLGDPSLTVDDVRAEYGYGSGWRVRSWWVRFPDAKRCYNAQQRWNDLQPNLNCRPTRAVSLRTDDWNQRTYLGMLDSGTGLRGRAAVLTCDEALPEADIEAYLSEPGRAYELVAPRVRNIMPPSKGSKASTQVLVVFANTDEAYRAVRQEHGGVIANKRINLRVLH